jgi:hypothetical protein
MASIFTGAGLAALTTLDTVLLRVGRNIAGIIPDCTISERHVDELEITDHPVETGSPVSDHAFVKPFELVMRVAWSDSKDLASLVNAAVQGSFPATVKDVYKQLRDLQQSLQAFSVVTGKRQYTDMLMKRLQVITERETENVLMVEATFRQIIQVSTQVQSRSALSANPANQASPQDTAAPVATGSVQLSPANSSAASTISAGRF